MWRETFVQLLSVCVFLANIKVMVLENVAAGALNSCCAKEGNNSTGRSTSFPCLTDFRHTEYFTLLAHVHHHGRLRPPNVQGVSRVETARG